MFMNRFERLRVLKEDRRIVTFLGTDGLRDLSNVVIKVLRKGRFVRDGNVLKSFFCWHQGLIHPQFAKVFDAGLTPRQDLYWVREYLPTYTPLSGQGTTFARSLISSIDFLRADGCVHGSIIPSNVFFFDNVVRLTDPRIPTLNDDSQTETSIRFTAPEVLTGAARNLESDLYSVGAILYRAFADRDPFDDFNLQNLKLKYLSLTPPLLRSFRNVSKVLSELVSQLLEKEPGQRQNAFEALKETLSTGARAASRAPFIGRQHELNEVSTALSRTERGQCILIEGEVGIGKSRLIQELSSGWAFRSDDFVVASCSPSQNEFGPICEALRTLIKKRHFSGALNDEIHILGSSLLPYFTPGARDKSADSLERIANELVGLVATLAGRRPVTLAIEDVDVADTGTLRFLEALSLRASELPLNLILSRRKTQYPFALSDLISGCFGVRFNTIRLPYLETKEAEALTAFVAPALKRQEVLELSGGNPLFIESYAILKGEGSCEEALRQLEKVLSWLSGQITKPVYSVAKVLSVFKEPPNANTLVKVVGDSPGIAAAINGLRESGLLSCEKNKLSFRYPAFKKRLYKTLASHHRKHLHGRILDVLLQEEETDSSLLAHHAYLAERYEQAAALLTQLARSHVKMTDCNAVN